MPKTIKDKERELIETPLAGELNFWDFDSENNAIIYVDGSVGCGFEIKGIDNECDSDDEINQRTLLIRSFLNNLPEDSIFQVIYNVDSDFGETLSSHHKETPSALINWISRSREEKFKAEEDQGILYHPKIYLFFRYFPSSKVVKAISFFQKKEKFSEEFRKNHEKMMEELNQKALDIESSLSTLGLEAKRLDAKKIKALIYDFLNPERAETLSLKE